MTQIKFKEDYKYNLDLLTKMEFQKSENQSKFTYIVTIVLFLITTTLMFAVLIHTQYRVRELEKEVNFLKISIKDVIEYFNADVFEDSESQTEMFVVMKPQIDLTVDDDDDDDDYDIDYEYGNYDETKIDQETLNSNLKINKTLNSTSDSLFLNLIKTQIDNTKSKRKKRYVVGYTNDGVPINSESYAESVRRNHSENGNQQSPVPQLKQMTSYPSTPAIHSYQHSSSYKTSPTSQPIYTRQSRVMLQEDPSKSFRQVVKKSSLLKSGSRNSEETSDAEFTVVRDDQVGKTRFRHRQRPRLENFDERHVRIGRMRPLPTIHFSGDTSKYVVGQHTNFNGNGHLRHPQRTFIDWKESNWVQSLGMQQHFMMSDGILTIKDSGLYFIYAQIYYLDEHDTNGFRVYKNDETILQCTTMTHSMERIIKGNTCYTAAAEYLEEGDRISLSDLSDARYSLFEPGKSFFGAIKLGDVKIK